MIPRLQKILSTNGYVVSCMTDQGKIDIDFKDFITQRLEKGNVYEYLLLPENFNLIKCNGRTLYWEGLATAVNLDGSKVKADFELDPIVLYELGIRQKRLVNV